MKHDKLDEEEKNMLSNLQAARRRVKKTSDVTADGQTIILVRLQNLKSVQIKLANKGNAYDYISLTDSMQRDVESYYGQQLPGVRWNSKLFKKDRATPSKDKGLRTDQQSHQEKVKFEQSRKIKTRIIKEEKEVKEVRRIRQRNPTGVTGMVVYGERIYTVHHIGLTIYCYSNDGELTYTYQHKGGENTSVGGMSLIMDGHTPMLVISDHINRAAVWIKIKDDFTLDHHHTQQLGYRPNGLYNDRGHLMISDGRNNKIHRYRCDGHLLGVITLPDDVRPAYVTRRGDCHQYAVRDPFNAQLVVISAGGQVRIRYREDIHSVKLGQPRGIITDGQGRILFCNSTQHQVVMLDGDGDEVKQLLQPHQLMNPGLLYLDTDHHRLYVSGRDLDDAHHVFVYDYTLLTASHKTLTENIRLQLTVEMD